MSDGYLRVLRVEHSTDPLAGVCFREDGELIDAAHPRGGWNHLPGPYFDGELRIPRHFCCACNSVQQFRQWWPREVIDAFAVLDSAGMTDIVVVLLEVDSDSCDVGRHQVTVFRDGCRTLKTWRMGEFAQLSDSDIEEIWRSNEWDALDI